MDMGSGYNRFYDMVNKIIRLIIIVIMICALCFAFYEIGERTGRQQAKVQIMEKQVEVIRYVEKKRAEINARPNANRSDLLKIMYADQL